MGTKKAGASTSLVAWDKKLAEDAAVAKGMEDSVQMGQWMSIKSGVLSFNGGALEGNHVEAVVLDHVLENVFYEGEFDADNPSGPVCFAFARKDGELKPHADSVKPQGGEDGMCKGCPKNEFGSADTGRGKACKNTRRLALIPADTLDSVDGIKDAQVAFMKLPVTSVKPWAAYVNQLAEVMKKPPMGVVTDIIVKPDMKNQVAVTYKCVDTVKNPQVLGALFELKERVSKEIEFPYVPFEDNDAAAKKKPAKKAAGKPKGKF